jgi:hypothetical protein
MRVSSPVLPSADCAHAAPARSNAAPMPVEISPEYVIAAVRNLRRVVFLSTILVSPPLSHIVAAIGVISPIRALADWVLARQAASASEGS